MMDKQKTIKKELGGIIKEYKFEDKISVKAIIEWIANEDETDVVKANNDYQEKWISYFAAEPDIDKLNKVLSVFTDAWNYFPHKSLNGKSPLDMYHKQ